MLKTEDQQFKFYHSLEDAENLVLHDIHYEEKDVEFIQNMDNQYTIRNFLSILNQKILTDL